MKHLDMMLWTICLIGSFLDGLVGRVERQRSTSLVVVRVLSLFQQRTEKRRLSFESLREDSFHILRSSRDGVDYIGQAKPQVVLH